MRRNLALAISISALVLLAGCSSPGGGSGAGSGSPTASPTPTATATTLDPCELVTAAEASQLSGVTFGAGQEETTGENNDGKRCVYGSKTKNVFFVQVATADNAADAQSAWATNEAQADAALATDFPADITSHITKTDLTGLGDRAAVATGSETISGVPISGGFIYLLKGANFLAFGDLTLATAPDAAALKAQAETSLGRMP